MKKSFLSIVALLLLAGCGQNANNSSNGSDSSGQANSGSGITISPDSAKAIAKEAWIYGYPMFYSYKSTYLYALDKSYPDNAGGFNRFKNYAKSFTSADTSIVTPNDDTPYSWGMLDLSDEPMILEVPTIGGNRYYVMQIIDEYTYNFAYVGTRAIGNKAGKYMIAGPGWKGTKPAGIDSVFYSETNLVTILGRTELMNAADLSNVKRIQSMYKITPLHEYLHQPAPAATPYTMPLPPWKESDYKSISFINILNALLQYTSVDPGEMALRQRFAQIGIVPGKPFDSLAYPKEVLDAIRDGIAEGEQTLKGNIAVTNSSLHLFGTRADLENDYVRRATAAAMGLFGNTATEAYYTGSLADKDGKPLTGENKYVIRFTKDQIPPVKYFWSITMYNLPQRYLVKNPIDRYSIGDRTQGLRYQPNGDLLIYIQSTSPGKGKEGNWLPSPTEGPFNYVVRLYGPKASVTDGTWKLPLPEKVN